MAVKTNCNKNGTSYFRSTASVGRDSNGKLIRKEFYGKSKSEAESMRDEYLLGIKSGLNIDTRNILLGKLMHTWLFETVRVSDRIKPTTFEKYECIYRLYVKDSDIYSIKIVELKALQIQRYYNKLSEKGKSKNQIENLNKLLKQFLNYAVDEGYLTKNPCIGKKIVIPGEKKSKEEVQHFSDEELHILISNLDNNVYRELILIAIGTGLRRGELLALTWEDIDLKNYSIRVNKSLSKVYIIAADGSKERKQIIQVPKTKGSIREVSFPLNLTSAFNDLKLKQKRYKLKCGLSYENSDYIFTTSSGSLIDVTNLSHAWENILKQAGLPHKKFHSLRHTFATKLFENEVPLKTVSELLGHSSIDITANTYTHVIPKEKSNAVEKLNYIFN
ncbi:recombinase XerC [Clostridium beijerinckii]|nr:recombinase XerC [Clostridium beijerinckii]